MSGMLAALALRGLKGTPVDSVSIGLKTKTKHFEPCTYNADGIQQTNKSTCTCKHRSLVNST